MGNVRLHKKTVIIGLLTSAVFILSLFVFIRISVNKSYAQATTPLLSDNFESYPQGTWPESSTQGPWAVNFNGLGSVGIETDGTQVLYEKPQASTASTETHSSLVTSTSPFGDIDYSVRIKTVSQLRTPTPNAWETVWVLWHYTDNTHFYYLNLKPNGWELGKEDPAYPGSQRFLATGSTPSYPVGNWYSVRVTQQNNVITIYVDGNLLTSFTDAERPYTTGSVGLYNEDAYVHFDDVSVIDPTTVTATPTPTPIPVSFTPAGMRVLPDPLYGVTIDNVANLSGVVTSLKNLSHMPTTRIVFDRQNTSSYYTQAVSQIQPVSYILGTLLDSSDMQYVSVSAFSQRVTDYLSAFGNQVDLWEVGNEINGEWLGTNADVVAKMTNAYNQVKAAGKRTELTLYYNGLDDTNNCYSNANNLMFRWAQANIPDTMKQGLDYVLISFYDQDCPGVSHDWNTVFTQLHQMFPNARIGFGENGTTNATDPTTLKQQYMDTYYKLAVNVPNYVHGHFWWYYYEDCVPYTNALWSYLNNDFMQMPVNGSTPTSAPTPTAIVQNSPTPTAIPVPSNTPTPTPTIPPATSTLTVFGDALGSGWQNWSWSASVNLAVASPVYNGTRALSFQVTKAYGALSFGHSSININAYKYLRFAAQATKTGQQYEVALENGSGKQQALVKLSNYGGNPVVGAWKVYAIPLSVLNPSKVSISTVDIEDAAGTTQPTLYVDDVKFTN